MKQQKFWLIVIPVLIALSVWVMVGSHYDAKAHRNVPYFPTKYGLDIHGGVRAVLQAEVDKAPAGTYNQETVRNILQNRINSAGVGEATVQPKGSDQFIVEIPSVRNKQEVLDMLGQTAQMTFYYFQNVECARDMSRPIHMDVSHDPVTKHELYNFFDKRTNQSFRDGAQIKADYAKILAAGTDARAGATQTTVTQPWVDKPITVYFTADQEKKAAALETEITAWQQFLKDSPVVLTGSDLKPESSAGFGGAGSTEPNVSQVFNSDGADKFAKFTSDHTEEIMGIVLDDGVLSAPNIREPILDGRGEISGGFTSISQAQTLANLLNAGSLPVPLNIIQVQSVEPTLGAGAVHKSVVAGLIGLVAVLIFMLAYYRLPGLVANVALLIYTLFTLAIFRGALKFLFPDLVVTLTLPGIAGFILSIGMAVDANILIFERLKEELRSGKSLRSAIDAGFKRAFTAIRDSNICTIITCVVLLTLGTVSVRGFAVTLLIGVLVSLFSAITVTRTLLYLLVNAGVGNNPGLFGLNVRTVPATKTAAETASGVRGWNIIGKRKLFYGLSALLILPGLFFLIFMPHDGLKKSIEFTGGTQIQVRYPQATTQDSVRAAVVAGGFEDPIVQMAEGGTVAIVSTEKSYTDQRQEDQMHSSLLAALNNVESGQKVTELSFDKVQGTISRELTSNAIQAVLLASVLIVLYLASVFSLGGFFAGLRFGVSAICALLHDAILLLGMFAIFGHFLGWKIDSLFVTAMLTVIGFSVHDTVVIFDRVRENLHHKQRGETFEPLVNRSIQQTLARSINTSLTVLMTLAALILFGGHTTLLLNVALFIGILSGTYSSIFNAASILVDWENALAKRQSRSAPPALAVAGGGPVTGPISNGGSSRPISNTTVTPADRFARPKTTTVAAEDEAGSSRIRPKKKKPARRF